MSQRSTLTLATWLTIASWGLAPHTAQAGPLLDWLFGRNRLAPAYPVGPAVPVANGAQGAVAGYGGYAGNYGTYYSSQLPAIGPAGAGYTAPMPGGIAAATQPAALPPTLSYVPNFQTQAQRAPVTYYRPLLTTDPNTGAQVVAMAPCSSYEYMAQRVPVLGRSALFGSSAPPVFQPPTQALPTYTLPSGGVPLAYSSPSITAPYSTAYGVYGTNPSFGGYPTAPSTATYGMAPPSVGQAGSFPTTALGQSAYYGAQNGGSCGGLGAGSVAPSLPPGLVAPQAPGTAIPGLPPANYPQFSAPPPTTYAPVPGYAPAPGSVTPSPVFPPPASNDPGSTAPQLPPDPLPGTPLPGTSAQSNLRPQLRSITRTPRVGDSPTVSAPTGQRNEATRDLPAMLPIPAPEDFQHQPRWSPPLLRDGDMTALHAVQPEVVQMAGQSKPIHWASFEQPSVSQARSIEVAAAESPVSHQPSTSGRLRPIEYPSQDAAMHTPAAAVRPTLPAARETGGWKVARP